jgi:phosphoadenosine phosphosulfate reductase
MPDDSRALPSALSRAVDDAHRLLEEAVQHHATVTLASSMGAEDMVLVDLVARENLPIDIFILDTGRLHDETQALIEETRTRYGLPIRILVPDQSALEGLLGQHGPNGFYRSVDLRKACCTVRKVEPLRRALAGYSAWVTGLRRGQSAARADTPAHEWDEANGLAKYNPLVDWSSADVWDYIRANDVPYNPLHDRGFTSIGCAPCSRAVAPGADERSGRWWWEDGGTQECGLHEVEGRMVRTQTGGSE